ncbi:MAG: hypothetical protein ACRC33_19380 [Gemmataceae bacterium]
MSLPSPHVTACYFDIGFVPPLAAMQLAWPDGPRGERRWVLPLGETITGPVPARFGVRIRRQDANAYAVTLVWDSTYRQWYSLRRSELRASDLVTLLAALGTPLDYLLDQPVPSAA